MEPRYHHIDVTVHQTAKHTGLPCGDVVSCTRDLRATMVLLCDGIGSGARAHIAARLCRQRLSTLCAQGTSVRNAFGSMARTMAQYKKDGPYTAFSLCRVRNDGHTTILSYEAPAPVLIQDGRARDLKGTILRWDYGEASEFNGYLNPGDRLLLFSDGISQAGLGEPYSLGWGSGGVATFLNRSAPPHDLSTVTQEASRLSQTVTDDTTLVDLHCRKGRCLTLLTGPPSDRRQDTKAVQTFLQRPGTKVICGGTTAALVGKTLDRPVTVDENPQDLVAPPAYSLEGIDLVTEGTVTLNQLRHLLDLDRDRLYGESPVTQLLTLLTEADRIEILIGNAHNPANQDIRFHQQGLLSRQDVLPMIAGKLRKLGKLVLQKNIDESSQSTR